ncbi:MAG: MFS transporter [Caulobacter sp.]|nr:MFS transporter [Caulobacter sp.]
MAKAVATDSKPQGTSANQLLFGFQGRAARAPFWLVAIAGAAVFALFWGMVNLKPPVDPAAPALAMPPGYEVLAALPWIIALGLIWPLAAIGVKRCHDRGRSGWWMLLALVPVAGQLWWLIDLGLLAGQAGANRFGEPASASGEDAQDLRSTTVMFFLGFSAGLPNLLVFGTLTIWLRDEGLSLTTITMFGLATMWTALKFLWAPIIDRTSVPILTPLLGHRRSWMLVSQVVLVLALWMISGTDPKSNLAMMALFAVLASFASANQDIVIDAWRIEVAEDAKQGAMAAAYQWGYRIALVIAGAVPLILAEVYSWSISYAVMAALMAIGIAATLFAPREAQHQIRPIDTGELKPNIAGEIVEWIIRAAILTVGALTLGVGLSGSPDFAAAILSALGVPDMGAALKAGWDGDWRPVLLVGSVVGGFGLIVLAALPIPGFRTRPGVILFSTLLRPVVEFFERYGSVAGLILALICVYRVADFLLNVNGAFYLDLGFTKLEIAEVQKVFGAIMSIFGVTLGGWSVLKLGMMRTLIIGALLGSLSNLAFAWLAMEGHSIYGLMIAIAADNVGGGFAGTALIAYMSSLTGQGFTATQYALFSSLYALFGKVLASQSGRIVEGVAKSANEGGAFSGINAWMGGLPAETYAGALAKSGVSPAALGTGYLVFYVYTTIVGLLAIALTFVVAAKNPQPKATAESTA